MQRSLRVLAALSAAAWLAHGLSTYWPFLSGEVALSNVLPSMAQLYGGLSRELGRDPTASAGAFLVQYKVTVLVWALVQLLGLVLSVIALARPSLAPPLLLVSSALYLAPWAWFTVHWLTSFSLVETVELKLKTAKALGSVLGLALKDLVLPVVFATGWTVSLTYLWRHRSGRASEA